MSVQEDIQKFTHLMQTDLTNKTCLQNYSGSIEFFDKPYLFTNEYLYQYMGELNLNGKSMLTTGSSGDQILFSLLFGAKDVTCFDINPFAKYVFGLKVAYIKALDYKQFYNIVTHQGTGFNELFNIDNYNLVCGLLHPETKLFWDSLFAAGLNPQTNMFTHSNKLDMFKCKYITNCAVYNNLKNVLKTINTPINFITCDIRDLPSKLDATKRYDVILLSNIFDYTHMWHNNDNFNSGRNQFKQTINNLAANFLNKDGTIQLCYVYSLPQYNLNKKALGHMFDYKKLSYISAGDEDGAMFYTPQKTFARQPGEE